MEIAKQPHFTDILREEIHKDIMIYLAYKGVIRDREEYKDLGIRDLVEGLLSIKKAVKSVYTDKEHPTMKPVGLIERLIKDSTLQNNIVLDVFAGSGTTLIACENLRRKCYAMELEPEYCDVIIKRWEDKTGRKAELLNKIS